MGKKTGISWCDHTFNPWWGCVRVSAGCERCYAETFARRLGFDVWGENRPRRFFGEKHWNEPLHWNRQAEMEGVRRRVFCASMADVFENPPLAFLLNERYRLWELVEKTPQLDWLVLTKRPENIKPFVPEKWLNYGGPDHVFMGTTIEHQNVAKKRLTDLFRWPGRNFVSVEPMLSPVSLAEAIEPEDEDWEAVNAINDDPEPEEFEEECEVECDWVNYGHDLVPNPEHYEWASWRRWRAGLFALGRLVDWVIIGGESGAGCRPMETRWVEALMDECLIAKVPVFVKQLGGHPDKRDRMEEWPVALRKQEFPRSGEDLTRWLMYGDEEGGSTGQHSRG